MTFPVHSWTLADISSYVMESFAGTVSAILNSQMTCRLSWSVDYTVYNYEFLAGCCAKSKRV